MTCTPRRMWPPAFVHADILGDQPHTEIEDYAMANMILGETRRFAVEY